MRFEIYNEDNYGITIDAPSEDRAIYLYRVMFGSYLDKTFLEFEKLSSIEKYDGIKVSKSAIQVI